MTRASTDSSRLLLLPRVQACLRLGGGAKPRSDPPRPRCAVCQRVSPAALSRRVRPPRGHPLHAPSAAGWVGPTAPPHLPRFPNSGLRAGGPSVERRRPGSESRGGRLRGSAQVQSRGSAAQPLRSSQPGGAGALSIVLPCNWLLLILAVGKNSSWERAPEDELASRDGVGPGAPVRAWRGSLRLGLGRPCAFSLPTGSCLCSHLGSWHVQTGRGAPRSRPWPSGSANWDLTPSSPVWVLEAEPGSSLLRSEILRTRVCHSLCVKFTEVEARSGWPLLPKFGGPQGARTCRGIWMCSHNITSCPQSEVLRYLQVFSSLFFF